MNEKLARLYTAAERELTGNILPWWIKYSFDNENGGFYGAVNTDNSPRCDAEKGLILNARILWTFSSAYRVLGDEKYLAAAQRAYEYLKTYFIDGEYGGAYYSLKPDGTPAADYKMTYGNAFLIYGCSEYARATGCEEAEALARKTADALDRNLFDPANKGYFEAADRHMRHNPWIRGTNLTPFQEKTMNTSLHLLEAYTCLARIDGSPMARNKVRELFYTMQNRILNRDIWHYHMFLTRDWKPLSTAISYGHDIEGSWLMYETAEVLGEKEAIDAARISAVNMSRACYEEGFTEEGGMRSEYDPVTGELHKGYSWWEQNEAVVGFLNAYQLTGEEYFLDASLKCFEFIDKYFVDHKLGGWFPGITEEKKPRGAAKASAWTCPYHSARMCLEIIERYRSISE